jgi:hypothetical protein
LRDQFAAVKPKKEDSSKETKFDGTQVLGIILQHWFLVNLSFQLPKFKNKDEDENNSSTYSDFDLKCKGPVPSP